LGALIKKKVRIDSYRLSCRKAQKETLVFTERKVTKLKFLG
jgi:hypothetical protein